MSPPSPISAILPPPFAWIDIPAGEVTLLNSRDADDFAYLKKDQPQVFDVPAFAMAKYPVTNAQFAKFAEAGGYSEERWWSDAGWKAKADHHYPATRLSQEFREGADSPVVGVSWYEALAFCAWLSEVAGEGISLPTEPQWQRAAQGDDRRLYPWGNEWDDARCNSSVGKDWMLNFTSPVTQYEGANKGDSPFGVTDMAGNVWEWCLTDYFTGEIDVNGTGLRVLRGGSWETNFPEAFRAAFRFCELPVVWRHSMGFRCVRSG